MSSSAGPLEELVNEKVLEAKARKRGLTAEELVAQEVDSKLAWPSEPELEAFYLGQRDRLNRPFAEVTAQLQQSLQQTRLQQARQDYVRRLREKADVAILLRPPKTEVSYDPARVRGVPEALVTIIEFSDFQCPFCKRVQPVLQQVLQKYEGRVRLAYRDFPLREIQAQAQKAAEASRCAGEQSKFWEFHDLLFDNRSKLDAAGLAQHARSLKLDEKRFNDCLASERYKEQVERDLQEGTQAGVSGTPGFFVNGIFLSGPPRLSTG